MHAGIHACRAGTTTTYSFGNDETILGDYAWYGGYLGKGNTNKEQYGHRVGTKKPNPWGLLDMHGNMHELCQDWYKMRLPGGRNPLVATDQGRFLRVMRGGSFEFPGTMCRSASRHWITRGGLKYSGFRVAIVKVR